MTDPQSIEGYLDCLSRLLDVSADAKDRLLEEVEDHLRQAAEEAVASGVPRALAERNAVARFGAVDTIADRAALAEAVASGRSRLRQFMAKGAVATAVIILFSATLLALDQRPVWVVLAAFLIGSYSEVLIYRARLIRWGLAPQASLEATLDREARAWLKMVRHWRYQLLLFGLFTLIWLPWVLRADQKPWRAVAVYGAVVLWSSLWLLGQRGLQARAEKELADTA
jgi:hypothetical protein